MIYNYQFNGIKNAICGLKRADINFGHHLNWNTPFATNVTFRPCLQKKSIMRDWLMHLKP